MSKPASPLTISATEILRQIAQGPAQQVRHARHQFIGVEGARLQHLFAREGEQALGERGRALRAATLEDAPAVAALMIQALSPDDAYIACELRPDEHQLLTQTLAGHRNAQALLTNGDRVLTLQGNAEQRQPRRNVLQR